MALAMQILAWCKHKHVAGLNRLMHWIPTLFSYYCICGVIVGVLASNAVDRGFEPWSGQTKDYKIDICCFSTKHAALRRKSKEW